MRNDMSKQITECSRRKYPVTGNRKREQRAGLENLPKQESMRISNIRGWNGFEFGENLTPLYNFLDSCVGRSWDDVYSEIRASLDTGSTIGMHVLQHVWDKVELHCTERDGRVYQPDGKEIYTSWRWDQLYVAEDGILKKAPKPEKVELEKLYDLVLLSPHPVFRYDYYRKKKGRWQKAVLCSPDQKIDKGKAQRICPLQMRRYSREVAPYVGGLGDPKGEKPNPEFDWVYKWRDVSEKEAIKLDLDNAKDFCHRDKPVRKRRQKKRSLSEKDFREILNAQKGKLDV